MPPTRIVTLLPGATEIVAALGAGARLVGISHECDYPPWVTSLPRVTSSPIDVTQRGGLIDAQVRELSRGDVPVVAIEADLLRTLRPDLLIAQALCDVCAVTDGQLGGLDGILDVTPQVLALTGTTLDGVLDDITRVGALLDLADDAEELVAGLRYRRSRLLRSSPTPRPRVLVIEWLDPLYFAGHWVPDLVAAAGGTDVGSPAGAKSSRHVWGELDGLRPDMVIIALCGFGVERAKQEFIEFTSEHPALAGDLKDLGCPVWLLDGNRYTSRSGPRLLDGAERIRAAIERRSMPGLLRYQW